MGRILILAERWAVTYNPSDRLFCVLKKSKHPNLFSVISDTFMLTVTDALTVEDIIKSFNEDPASQK